MIEYKSKTCDKWWLCINVIFIALGYIFSENSFSVAVIILVWINLILYGMQKRNVVGNALTLSNSNALRGISAIEIMIGHIGIETVNILQFPNRKAGILFVGIFFMLSGYGLAYGYYNKEKYLKNFLSNRFTKIIVPAFIVILCTVISSGNVSIKLVWGGARWYVCELLVLYFCFYIVYKFFSKYASLMLFVLSIIIVLGAYFIGLDNPWYGSTLCFPLGVYYYKWCDKTITIKMIQRIVVLISLFTVLAVSVLGFFVLEGSFIGNVVARSFASLSFCIITLLVCECWSLGNIFNKWLSEISYEIYLVHPLVILWVNKYAIPSDYIYTLVVISITIIVSIVFHFLLKNLII